MNKVSEKIYTVEEIKKMVYGILKKFNGKKAQYFVRNSINTINSKIFNDIEKERITIYGQ